MNLEEDEFKVADYLISLDRPLKSLKCKYIYSDALSCCSTKRKLRLVSKMRQEHENEQRLHDDFLKKQNQRISLKKIEEISDIDDEYIHDPFYRFGLGVFSYLSLMRILIRYFLFMTIIACIQMYLINGDISVEE